MNRISVQHVERRQSATETFCKYCSCSEHSKSEDYKPKIVLSGFDVIVMNGRIISKIQSYKIDIKELSSREKPTKIRKKKYFQKSY